MRHYSMRSGLALVILAMLGCQAGSGAGATAGALGHGGPGDHRGDGDLPPAELTCTPTSVAGTPAITSVPLVSLPPMLDWPRDVPAPTPDLTEPTSNRLEDLHGEILDCSNMDLVLSTAGNYHMALRDLFRDVLLPSSDIENWYYTTSPPISVDQVANSAVGFGNFELGCRPMVAVGPRATIDALAARRFSDGTPYAQGAPVRIWNNQGNVILVRRGNPRHIRSVWDLGRDDVRVITPHPCLESGTFSNYSGTIYNVALHDAGAPAGWTAERLFDSIFNSDREGKWLIGARIHHREVPWAIAYGEADAGVIFYHLALHAVRTFPDEFEIVPLGGTADDPEPLPGNQIGAHFAVRINGPWTDEQLAHREELMSALVSPEFAEILERHGLIAP